MAAPVLRLERHELRSSRQPGSTFRARQEPAGGRLTGPKSGSGLAFLLQQARASVPVLPGWHAEEVGSQRLEEPFAGVIGGPYFPAVPLFGIREEPIADNCLAVSITFPHLKVHRDG